jgi:hypothetical protein
MKKVVVISPSDAKAIAFFAKIAKKKEELRIKIESKLNTEVVGFNRQVSVP